MDYKKLNKKAMKCMYVKTWITNLILIAILLVCNFILKEDIPAVVGGIIYGVAVLMVVYAFVAPKVRYERYRFLLNEEEFAVRKGLLVVKTEIVPIERLHKIEVSSGPIFRAFGLKEIKVTTAGGEIDVSYLEDEVADKIADHLKKRINTIAVEERSAEEEDVTLSESDKQDVTIIQGEHMEGEHGAE